MDPKRQTPHAGDEIVSSAWKHAAARKGGVCITNTLEDMDLADLMTADTIYGTGILRADAGVAIAVVA